MGSRENESRELARLLATPEGRRLARLLQATGTLLPPAPPDPPSRPVPEEPLAGGPPAPRPISIWQPREIDGELVFERPEPGPLGDHYADRRRLPARKGAERRICFFGESAAAGYLYAPHWTPAKLLEMQLRHSAGPEAFEVIDLARTNETLGSLVDTVVAATQLSPDLLVIYTGNNWNLLETPELSPYAPAVMARQRYAGAVATSGILGPALQARLELAARAGRAFAEIAALGLPVVLVLPEVNLADWESPQPVVWLPGDGTAHWYQAYFRALEFLASGRAAEAEAAAWEMVELDGGSNPTPFRLLARALLAQGRPEEARDACLSEIDAQPYPLLAFLGAPQATTLAREIQEEAARRHGFATVDLRAVFAGCSGSPLPGRRLFLDYCHLTIEGMQVAIAAMAAVVSQIAGVVPVEPAGPAPTRETPETPEIDALAKVGAALHNAHRLLTVGGRERKLALLEHWLAEALAASPGVAATLLDLAAARATPGPAVLSAAFRRNFASPYRLLLQHGWRWDFLDADLLEAIGNVLTRAGHPEAGEVERLLLAGYPLPAEGVDLARPPFLAEPLARFFPEALASPELAGRAFLRSPWPETSFCLVAAGEVDVDLLLTARLPTPPGGGMRRGEVSLTVGGHRLAELPLTEAWSRQAVRIGRDRLRRGLNRITLRWPLPPSPGEAALAAALRRLEEGIEADLHPVFGEVFSLLARPGESA
ncbi:MAG TPA: hypothetical protein VMM92_09760 [Thermoanaerobaculia bacterium]|nr:hypothetical protein [Thermoanaerobaculia bacterium]